MNRIAAVLALALFAFVGCASVGHVALGTRAEPQDLCRLTVDNQTPYTFKFRVGHLWWEEQSGLLPHTTTGSKPMLIEQDEEHILVRVISVEGRVTEDRYYFYVPKGTKEHTITFGGLQAGVVVNRTAEDLRVIPPGVGSDLPDSVTTWGFVLHPGQSQKFSVTPGKASFVVYYGGDDLDKRYVEIRFRIDDVHRDVAYNDGYVDWVGYIQPSDLNQGRSARSW